ncbi:hypothetical protein O181_088116 [Austropuccinia psidii MF-1]|uniref:Uncharacterized protein n=1 Tax=Austropuccinia psidii MF-1 TaxID=1389203 RepID=A0A9Q3IQZ5_9BASI|nr:hypothetical protein [Austropuccinia psidii MF-1]
MTHKNPIHGIESPQGNVLTELGWRRQSSLETSCILPQSSIEGGAQPSSYFSNPDLGPLVHAKLALVTLCQRSTDWIIPLNTFPLVFPLKRKMLLSSLLSTMFLAASVISIPTTQTMNVKNSLSPQELAPFSATNQAIFNAKEPMQELCKKGDGKGVEDQFKGLQEPVHVLAIHIGAMIRSVRLIALKCNEYLLQFVQIILNMDVIVVTVHGHSEILAHLSVQVRELDLKFQTILGDFKKANTNVVTGFEAHEINFEMWVEVGFEFARELIGESPNTKGKKPKSKELPSK